MIESIHIKNVASYTSNPEELKELSQQNFIYGSNGVGKTTISRVIANPSLFPSCDISWKDQRALETMVYNRDFVENNFYQSTELKGIFTLGQESQELIANIAIAKGKLDEIKDKGIQLKNTLEGNNEKIGKQQELLNIEKSFEDKCWELKKKYDAVFKEAFAKVRGRKYLFSGRIISESNSNRAELKDQDYLTKQAKIVFGVTPQSINRIANINADLILSLHDAEILTKKVIGKEDVDISAMIKKLGSSDWVDQGRAFYNSNDDTCPFCQRKMEKGFSDSLEEYFDETYKQDLHKIQLLSTKYKASAAPLVEQFKMMLTQPSDHLNKTALQSEVKLLESKLETNLSLIEKKYKESSQIVEMERIDQILATISEIIDQANIEIDKHNNLVKNFSQEKKDLTDQVWKFLLEKEIKTDLRSFLAKKSGLEKAIDGIKKQIQIRREEYKEKDIEIQKLEKSTTSIQPTVTAINSLLKSFGFTGFSLDTTADEKTYKIVRPNQEDAKDTLSEGEKTFISFIYFYYLLKGSDSESGMTNDRIVVFDDPISSLDSDVLFIVSSLIKGLFKEIQSEEGYIKQVFILTHNVYFFKEVSFNPKRSQGIAMSEETFWTVTKPAGDSKLLKHESNPIKTSYELLWNEIKSEGRSNLSVQNTMRRILENYFKILGNVNFDSICELFDGKEKLICNSLFSWINDGSHFAHDDIFVANDEFTVEVYLKVFKDIFIKSKHESHYEMMMGSALHE